LWPEPNKGLRGNAQFSDWELEGRGTG